MASIAGVISMYDGVSMYVFRIPPPQGMLSMVMMAKRVLGATISIGSWMSIIVMLRSRVVVIVFVVFPTSHIAIT